MSSLTLQNGGAIPLRPKKGDTPPPYGGIKSPKSGDRTTPKGQSPPPEMTQWGEKITPLGYNHPYEGINPHPQRSGG